MKDFLLYILTFIVDHPKDLSIEEKDLGGGNFQYIISANSEDIGKIIGKEGKIITSLRNIARILAVKENKQINLEISDVR